MKDILSDIIAYKRMEVERQKAAVPADVLRQTIENLPPARTVSMKQSLAASDTGIIAEFKRRSPSKGWIHAEAKAEDVCPDYERAGAAALSVLTDRHFFGGTLADLQTARACTDLPLLRKDFVIDSYQLLQARACGANAVLLIAACLSPEEVMSLAGQAHALELEVLMEVHTPEELACLCPHVDMLGVNNRHLGSFHTDVRTSFDMLEALAALPSQPEPPLLVSESGLSDAQIVRQLRRAGYRGFLIGENFMKSPHPGKALSAFLQNLNGPCV